MAIFYSKSSNGFYHDEVHEEMPSDAIEITDDEYAALLEAQATGQVILGDSDGKPFTSDPVPLSPNEQIKAQLAALDASITPRRREDYDLGKDGGWLLNIYAQKAALRKRL